MSRFSFILITISDILPKKEFLNMSAHAIAAWALLVSINR